MKESDTNTVSRHTDIQTQLTRALLSLDATLSRQNQTDLRIDRLTAFMEQLVTLQNQPPQRDGK